MITVTENTALGRIEQKVDSLIERLFNDGSGLISTLIEEQKDARDKLTDLETAQAVMEAGARKDARWIAGIGAVLGAVLGALIHFLGGH